MPDPVTAAFCTGVVIPSCTLGSPGRVVLFLFNVSTHTPHSPEILMNSAQVGLRVYQGIGTCFISLMSLQIQPGLRTTDLILAGALRGGVSGVSTVHVAKLRP